MLGSTTAVSWMSAETSSCASEEGEGGGIEWVRFNEGGVQHAISKGYNGGRRGGVEDGLLGTIGARVWTT